MLPLRKKNKHALLILALGSTLAACASGPTPAPTPEPAPQQVVEPTPQAVPQLPDPPAPESTPIVVDMGRVEGQTPADVLAYLGAPTLVRRDENVQVMIFEADRCVVEVIFYEPENGDHFRADWVSARLRNGQDTDLTTCAREWLEQSASDQ